MAAVRPLEADGCVELARIERSGLIESRHLGAAAVVDAVQARGYDQLVCEGGPTLATQLRAAGLVDEMCLTTAPMLGGRAPFSADDEVTRLIPRQILVDDEGFSYGRWVPAAD